MTTDREQLDSAVALLKRLKSSLMRTRLYGDDTINAKNRTCSDTEGDIEEWLNAYRVSIATRTTGDENNG